MSVKIEDERKLFICCLVADGDGNFNLNMIKYHAQALLAKNEHEALSVYKKIKENIQKIDKSNCIVLDLEQVIRKVSLDKTTIANLKCEFTISPIQESDGKSIPASTLMGMDTRQLILLAKANKPLPTLKEDNE